MAKIEKRKERNQYEQRRKRIISIVCIVLAAMFLLWTVAGTMLFTFGQETEGVASQGTTQTEEKIPSRMRGIWVCTVGNLDYPTRPSTSPEALKAEADVVIRDCYDMGMNTIFLQVRPAADAFYRSNYYPWSRYLTGTQGVAPDDGFDPLAYWVEKAHERGIELHAWINPYRITTSSSDWNRMSEDNPAKGAWNDYVIRYNGNYYFDPGQPAVRDLITAAATEIVENYKVDGIHFDDYFYPDPSSGAAFNDAGSYAAYGNGMSLADWRRENVNQLIKQVNHSVHAANPNCVFGVSPMGVWANKSTSSLGTPTRAAESYSQLYADTYTWVKNNWLDYIAPQIYWKIGYSAADYQTIANWWNQVVQGTDVRLYIGMADYRAIEGGSGWSGPSELVRQLQLNDSLPYVSGEIHFRYKSVAGSTELFNLYKERYAANRVPALTNPVSAGSDTGLYDIVDHWAETYILSLVRKGVITGMGDGTFRPNAPVTRAQFVKMLALNSSFTDFDQLPDTQFKDVDPRAWFNGPIKWAVAKGIVSGRSSTEFAPDENITREEMAVVLRNYCLAFSDIAPEELKTSETDAIVDSEETGTLETTAKFQDESDVAGWAVNSVQMIRDIGIMKGIQEEKGIYFYPSRNTTRAEAAKVIFELSALDRDSQSNDSQTEEEPQV